MMISAVVLAFAALVAAQAANYGQCGGQGWAGATTCNAGWACTAQSTYYSQCLPSSSSGSDSSATSGYGTPTSTSASSGPTPTLIPGLSFIRAVEDPNYHQYLQGLVLNSASAAVVGSPSTAGLFNISSDGQLMWNAPAGSSTWLYAQVEPRANSSVMMLGMSWGSEPASGDAEGTFFWSGDTLEWSIPTIDRPQDNAWLVCPDSDGNKLLYINLGPYDYETPTGCADETIHAYTGPYATS